MPLQMPFRSNELKEEERTDETRMMIFVVTAIKLCALCDKIDKIAIDRSDDDKYLMHVWIAKFDFNEHNICFRLSFFWNIALAMACQRLIARWIESFSRFLGKLKILIGKWITKITNYLIGCVAMIERHGSSCMQKIQRTNVIVVGWSHWKGQHRMEETQCAHGNSMTASPMAAKRLVAGWRRSVWYFFLSSLRLFVEKKPKSSNSSHSSRVLVSLMCSFGCILGTISKLMQDATALLTLSLCVQLKCVASSARRNGH